MSRVDVVLPTEQKLFTKEQMPSIHIWKTEGHPMSTLQTLFLFPGYLILLPLSLEIPQREENNVLFSLSLQSLIHCIYSVLVSLLMFFYIRRVSFFNFRSHRQKEINKLLSIYSLLPDSWVTYVVYIIIISYTKCL